MLVVSLSRRAAVVQKTTRRCLSLPAQFYVPTLTPRRPGEAGGGGRSSEAGLKIAVIGASGFLGKYFSAELGANGYMGYFGNRGDEMEMRHIKPSFDLGRTRFVFYNPRDRDSIKDVIADADVVVNMIGKYYETGQPVQTDSFPFIRYRKNYSFHETNVDIAHTLADVCREMQVDHFVHVSSASAKPDARSEWSRTKYQGELAVKEAYPWATIVRPTQIFGGEDLVLSWFARMARWYKMVPLVDGGKRLTQPVFVGDVAKTLLRVCDDPAKFVGRSIDCFGPTDYTYQELANFVNDITERNVRIFNMPYFWYKQLAKVMQYTRDPLVTPDLVEVWSEDFLPRMAPEAYAQQGLEVTDPKYVLTMQDLGIQPKPLEKEAFGYLYHYRTGGHFYRVDGYRP